MDKYKQLYLAVLVQTIRDSKHEEFYHQVLSFAKSDRLQGMCEFVNISHTKIKNLLLKNCSETAERVKNESKSTNQQSMEKKNTSRSRKKSQ